MRITAPITELNGVGPKKEALLKKLGLNTIGDLLSWYPRRYEDRRTVYRIADAPEGESVCICAVVSHPPTTSYIRKGLTLTRTSVFDNSASLTITFFNQPYTANTLKTGQTLIFYGTVERNCSRYSMTNPVFEREGVQQTTGCILPVYPLTAGVSNLQLARWVLQALQELEDPIPDELPHKIRMNHNLAARDWSIRTIHRPPDFEALAEAKRRLVFEELFYLTAGLAMLHTRRQTGSGCLCEPQAVEDYTALLPFSFTGAQNRVLTEIFQDLSSGQVMNRLVQGDVGSGKTAVAAGAIWMCARSGWQSALMAPTEILARQHYDTLTTLLTPAGIRIGLLTGSSRAAERRAVLKALSAGELDLIVGTHALLGNGVEFARLGLVVTDEQHRFGVGQRSALSAKAGDATPHVLVMSATPIPRTLALIIYGDLDVSIIDERPPGRQSVDTFLVGEDKRSRMYGFVRKQVEMGHQVYMVCPAVEDMQDGSECKNVTAYAKELSETVFSDLRVGLIHGKLSAKAKQTAMQAFTAGEIDILVSTTVIEVGVDVPNATLIVIENADRFGLSQLHQLRGRVGRSSAKAYCVLVSSTKNPDTRQRLKALCSTNDGFKIAEKDLELRGPGDFFGSRQHGLPQLQVADLASDTRTLQEAKQAAEEILQDDPALEKPENRPILTRVQRLFSENPDIFN